MSEQEPTGTPKPETGDAPKGDAGHEAADVGSELARIREQLQRESQAREEAERKAQEAERKHQQLLAQKTNFERREAAPVSPQERQFAEYQQVVAGLQLRAQDPDPAVADLAKAQLIALSMQEQSLLRSEQQRREDENERQIAGMPEEIRENVRKFFNENRQLFGTPEAARRAWTGDTLAAREAKIKERERELELDAKRREEGKGPPVTRGVTGDEVALRKMSRKDYLEKVRAGDRSLIALKDGGKLELTD
jgi:hypothetical protein